MNPSLPINRRVRYTKEIWTDYKWRIISQEERAEPVFPKPHKGIKQCFCGHKKTVHFEGSGGYKNEGACNWCEGKCEKFVEMRNSNSVKAEMRPVRLLR